MASPSLRVAVLGATGAVGAEILQVLDERLARGEIELLVERWEHAERRRG